MPWQASLIVGSSLMLRKMAETPVSIRISNHLVWSGLVTGSSNMVIFQLDTHNKQVTHDDVIKWKHFLHYWPFVWGIHRSPVNSPHKGQWCRALMLSLISTWINGWVNNCGACDLRRHRTHYDVIVMSLPMGAGFRGGSIGGVKGADIILGSFRSGVVVVRDS